MLGDEILFSVNFDSSMNYKVSSDKNDIVFPPKPVHTVMLRKCHLKVIIVTLIERLFKRANLQ